MTQRIKQRDPNELAAGYTAGHRLYEWGGIIGAVVSGTVLCVRIAKCPPLSGWWVPLAAFVGLLAADFVSGFVHWAFDTWGAVDTPVFGKLAIRTFREHHVDAKAITRHDYVETNGHNYGLAFPVLAMTAYYVTPSTASLFDTFFGMSIVAMCFFVCMTSQIHKWAHQDKPSSFVALLQRARLILSPEHHEFHHTAPYTRNYCITIGWLNGPLRAIRFFETLERIISAVTGMVPREDDIGKEAAIAVAQELDEELAVPSEARPELASRE